MDDELDIKKQFESLRDDITRISRHSVQDHQKMQNELLNLIKTYTTSGSESTLKENEFIFNKDSIISDLNDLLPSNQIKYETIEEIAHYISNLKAISNYYNSLSKAIDSIEFDSKDLQQDPDKIVAVIKDHIKHLITTLNPQEIEINEKDITSNIKNLVRDISEDELDLEKLDQKLLKDGSLTKNSMKKNQVKEISHKYFKDIIKQFAIYQLYKVMNPRRIAGETKKENYKHNMVIGGNKLAVKHEGGKPAEVASYDKSFIKKVNQIAKTNKGFSR